MDIIKTEGFERIYEVDVFSGEYKKLFGKNKRIYEKELDTLHTRLDFLDRNEKSPLEQQQFEPVHDHPPLYSIRHVSQANPRVVFVFAEQDRSVVLLACTLEKSTNDYKKVIARAEERLKLLEGD